MSGAVSARHMCGSRQSPSPGSYLGWARVPSIFLQKVLESSREWWAPISSLGSLKLCLEGCFVASGLSIDGNLWVGLLFS